MIYIFWTTSTLKEAKAVVQGLLEARLIACANIFPEVHSLYRWEGKVEESKEVKVILKSTKKHFKAIEASIQKHGSYEVPEISEISIENAHAPYLQWLNQQVD